jgi:hypothetical protein
MTALKITAVGNSGAVLLPKELLAKMRIDNLCGIKCDELRSAHLCEIKNSKVTLFINFVV